MISRYVAAGHRIQTAIATLMDHDPTYRAVETKHLRTGIDMSKSDAAGLAHLLIAKGVFTKDEYFEAIAKSAEDEADSYERQVQVVLGNRNMRDQDDCVMQKAETNHEQAEPGVTLRRHTAKTAIHLAEQAVDEINARLRDAERERGDFARKLGAHQDMVDRLLGEREYRSRHVRDLLAARDA